MAERGEVLLTADEAAALLRCSVRQLRRLRRRGVIPDVRTGARSVRVPRSAIDEFVRSGGISAEVSP